ncbi:four-carbon acid sugar kinase family protein [Pedobacter heparinus]|uniref:Type III effector Hrp-dependent outers n=1 Tax=Pedobacter heparinus (strain ATCC 13125 / DSM 2366 / CIP 104194 / JCM 7457 / NBRC 12017 / NCIMB 9290 / NRRL B-14731 / HIM 762-3) TaxID=485917 RepID=C6Y120_PEDHD|nr:four-carbon acid sugar kinase family protein [Pedobacter heparinus]ACU04947.1 type III effector Hrp-dependent outers [Pedobacter heparinus DSM 2366]
MEVTKNKRLLMAFYGDDFTGSTDALEFLSRSGIKTVLFIETPSAAQLARYPELQAIGIAGMSRTMSPAEMEVELQPAFKALAGLNPRHVHYKVCSTFDSSPAIGSIGKAIDIGAAVFNTKTVPLLVAAPILGRYCLFGNLFARMGIGSQGNIYRLDRHPSMSRHPVTPAEESDLRLHLGKQTTKNIGLFDILALHQYQQESTALKLEGEDIVLFDALQQEDLKSIGAIIDGMATVGQTLFSAGSSGIEMALGAHWQENGTLNKEVLWEDSSQHGPVLIASGSCSPVTAAQIAYALKNGFTEIAIDTISLAERASAEDLNADSILITEAAEKYALQATELIRQGKHPLIHTSLGNDDQRVNETDQLFREKNFGKAATAQLYGSLLGMIARKTAERIKLKRVVIAGGDTSSYAARAMGIAAVEMIAPLSPGAPVCRADAPGSAIDQLELVFKGGQVGKEDFFNNNLIATKI